MDPIQYVLHNHPPTAAMEMILRNPKSNLGQHELLSSAAKQGANHLIQ
jgi:hypothetical protein